MMLSFHHESRNVPRLSGVSRSSEAGWRVLCTVDLRCAPKRPEMCLRDPPRLQNAISPSCSWTASISGVLGGLGG